MKLELTIKETELGDVAVELRSEGMKEATKKEQYYGVAIRELLHRVIPELGKTAGAVTTVQGSGDPSRS